MNVETSPKLALAFLGMSILVPYIVCVVGEVNVRFRWLMSFLTSSCFVITLFSRTLLFHRIPILRKSAYRVVILTAIFAASILVPFLVIAHKIPEIGLRFPRSTAQGVAPVIEPGPKISVVIPHQDEVAGFLEKTIQSIYAETREDFLLEIIVVDDGSSERLEPFFQYPKMKILRNDEPQGLTRTKIRGADFASGTHIMFLDAHCKVGPNWAEWLLGRSASASYKDIIIPRILSLSPETFSFESISGFSKLMFEWNFEFSWVLTDTPEAPVLPGGIQLMTRRRWLETRYDDGMLQWGGENIEQSLMTWICGGKIFTEERAIVGHVFDRPVAKVAREQDVIVTNLARAAFVWLDDFLELFKTRRGSAASTIMDEMSLAGLDKRLAMRHRLECGTFRDYLEKFDRFFDEQGMFVEKETAIMHVKTGLCLSIVALSDEGKVNQKPVRVEWDVCRPYDKEQRFTPVRGNVLLRSVAFERCLERRGTEVILSPCSFIDVKVEQIFSLLPDGWLGHVSAEGDLRRVRTCLTGPEGFHSGDRFPVLVSPCSNRTALQIKIRPIFTGV